MFVLYLENSHNIATCTLFSFTFSTILFSVRAMVAATAVAAAKHPAICLHVRETCENTYIEIWCSMYLVGIFLSPLRLVKLARALKPWFADCQKPTASGCL